MTFTLVEMLWSLLTLQFKKLLEHTMKKILLSQLCMKNILLLCLHGRSLSYVSILNSPI